MSTEASSLILEQENNRTAETIPTVKTETIMRVFINLFFLLRNILQNAFIVKKTLLIKKAVFKFLDSLPENIGFSVGKSSKDAKAWEAGTRTPTNEL
jgi:hypothetical protein